MKVLMISIDRGLLGKNPLGDVIKRHKKYGEFCQRLDIVVFAKGRNEVNEISEQVTVYPTNSKNKIKYCFDALKISKDLFVKNNYDLVVTQEPFLAGLVGCKLKKIFGAKLLVHFHGDFWQNKSWLKENRLNHLLLLISKFVVSKADAIRVMSSGQKEKLLKAGIEGKKIRVISTPVDLDWIMALEEKKQKDNQRMVLHVGRDDRVKNYDTLVQAFKIVKEKITDVLFYQAGADKQIKKAILKFNFNDIRLVGQKNHQDLFELYYQSSVLVLSSDSESFGKVLLEANACGKPVVSTATTGAQEIIQDGYNGFLVPIGDSKVLAEKIIYLLENPDIAKTMGENGRKLVKEKYGDNTKKIIELWQWLTNH